MDTLALRAILMEELTARGYAPNPSDFSKAITRIQTYHNLLVAPPEAAVPPTEQPPAGPTPALPDKQAPTPSPFVTKVAGK